MTSWHDNRAALARVRELGAEVEALSAVFDDAKTYHNAVVLQNRRREREGVIAGLRGKFAVVANDLAGALS